MYAAFFGLRELPFNNTPDPRFFYSTPDHEEALASLIYAVQERKGFVLLTGEVGAGKTLVSRMMVKHFGAQIAFASIHHAVQGAGDLLQALCAEFELPVQEDATHNKLVRTLHDFLLSEFSKDLPVVLILDEAQALTVDAFEQLRMIGNLEADDAKLLQIVILGQPELQQRFATPEFRQLRQRMFRTFHLPALTRDLTEEYIRHRLTIAGAPHTDVFDRPAIDRIYYHSKGLPRIINTICDNAMLSAYSANCRRLDAAFVDATVAQMMTLGDAVGGTDPDENRAARTTPTDAGAPMSSLEPSADANSGTLINFLSRRVGELEGRLSAARCDALSAIPENRPALDPHAGDHLQTLVSQADAATSRLEPLVHHAVALTDALQVERGKSEQEEARLTQMARTSRSILSEIRRVFEGLRRAGVKARLAETRAQEACDRLEGQRRVGEAVFRHGDGQAPQRSDVPRTESSGPTVLKAGSAPAATVPTVDFDRSVAGTAPDLRRSLSESRHSLESLRTMLREKQDERTVDAVIDRQVADDSAADAALRPTMRLASQVDALFQLVASDRS